MKNKHILLVIIILISLLFLNGCKKIENNGNNSHDYSDYHYTDERRYKREIQVVYQNVLFQNVGEIYEKL